MEQEEKVEVVEQEEQEKVTTEEQTPKSQPDNKEEILMELGKRLNEFEDRIIKMISSSKAQDKQEQENKQKNLNF